MISGGDIVGVAVEGEHDEGRESCRGAGEVAGADHEGGYAEAREEEQGRGGDASQG